MKSVASKISLFKESIFATMSRLAREHGAINLSQGFPDFDCHDWLKDLVTQAMKEGQNQYAPFIGLESARKSIASYYEKFYKLRYDVDQEITLTCGATEAIFTSILALVDPGDEVVVFEPFYDSYLAAIQIAGGIAVPVTLKAPSFSFSEEDLQRAFSPKTKLVILNNPHNPTGRLFGAKELEVLRQYVLRYDAFVLSDEVYEFLVYDQAEHVPTATLEGMKDRTLTVSSMGKTFGVTGWKLGWVASSATISHAVRMVHQFNTFSVSTPVQVALAHALDRLDEVVPELRKEYCAKRDYFFQGLQDRNFRPVRPQGSYFIMCPIGHLTSLSSFDFCVKMIKEKNVAAIPASPFYAKSQEGNGLVRFCFAKKQATLEAALARL